MEKITDIISKQEQGVLTISKENDSYIITNYNPHTGERLPDTVLPMPSKDEIEIHIAELTLTLGRTQADAVRLQTEIEAAQKML